MLRDRFELVINSLNDVIKDNQENDDLVNELTEIANEMVEISSAVDVVDLDRKLFA